MTRGSGQPEKEGISDGVIHDRSVHESRYVLGTEHAELLRLGLQHQVWSAEARILCPVVMETVLQV